MNRVVPMSPVRQMSKSPGSPALFAWLALAALAAANPAPITAQPACEPDQPRIAGLVVDAGTAAPLEGALVSVGESSQAWLTTDSGRFLLCEVGTGTHGVTVERLGYETLTIQVTANAAGAVVRFQLEPRPILLEGLEIVMDRFSQRRRAAATVVRTFDQAAIARSGHWAAGDFVMSRGGVFMAPCGAGRCVFYRGTRVSPVVYLDEVPLIGGWNHFETLPTSLLYMVEVYRKGTHIRAYTHAFMERAARNRLAPLPIWEAPAFPAGGCINPSSSGRHDRTGWFVRPGRSVCPTQSFP